MKNDPTINYAQKILLLHDNCRMCIKHESFKNVAFRNYNIHPTVPICSLSLFKIQNTLDGFLTNDELDVYILQIYRKI